MIRGQADLLVKIARQLGVAAMAVVFLALPAFAQVVTFSWDPHEQAAELTGFRLYQSKTSGGYGTTPVAAFSGGATVTGQIPQPTLGLKPKPPRLLSALQAIESIPRKEVSRLAGLFRHKDLHIRS